MMAEKKDVPPREESADEETRELDCTGYRDDKFKTFLFYTGAVMSCGFLLLIGYWRPAWKVYMTASRCPLALADYVVFVNIHGSYEAEDVCVDYINSSGVNDASVQKDASAKLPETNIQHMEDTRLRRKSSAHLSGTAALHDYAWNPSESADDDDGGDEAPLLVKKGQENQFAVRYFIHHKLRFFYQESEDRFLRLKALDSGVPCASIRRQSKGLSSDSYEKQKVLFGENIIDVDVKPYWKLVLEEALDPFYIFQLFSIVLWCAEVYYYYAATIFVISCVSIGYDVYEIRQQMKNLFDMVASPVRIAVLRFDRHVEGVSSRSLVPGDIIVVPPAGLEMPCDAALLSGTCVVNESMLTGESVPVTKTPLPDQPVPDKGVDDPANHFLPDRHKRHVLFCGTRIIQTRPFDNEAVMAIVVRTGFATAKGSLVRSILYPKPVGFKFFRDALRFVGFLAVLAFIGFIYSIVMFIRFKVDAGETAMRALDIITIAVPPALPAAMTVGTLYALKRLQRQNIFCISPPRINICGKLKLFCFDKTGTLTEEGLDLTGVLPVNDREFGEFVKDVSTLPEAPLLFSLATSHSLTVIDGELVGDPLDLKMFEATKWVFEESASMFDARAAVMSVVRPAHVERLDLVSADGQQPGLQLGIMRQFTFSSELQRMSVLVQRIGAKRAQVFCKGAPEMIVTLCDPETVPENFSEVLTGLTQQGYRVLALAYRTLNEKWHVFSKMPRANAEKDLTLLGFIAMRNTLKPETTPIIANLRKADIRTVMVTGDNIQTAVSVARECNMVSQHQKVLMLNAYPASEDEDKPTIAWSVVGEPSEALMSSMSCSFSMTGGVRPSYQNGSTSWNVETEPYRIAMSGKSFAVVRQHFPELMEKVLMRGSVFARMKPDQKTQLVQHFQAIGYCVGMCGDGANDCGALKAAHAGISLSEAEASVASPFTSKTPNITCVPTLIREGRAALVTSFSVFKFMALYSIIQYVSVLILYSIDSNLGDQQYLYIDVLLNLGIALVMGRTHAYPTLVSRRPPGSLSGVHVISSLVLQIIIQTTFQAGAYEYLKSEDWFVPLNVTNPDSDNINCSENYVIFFVSAFQYIWTAVAFSQGRPYRMPMYTNASFLLVVAILVLLTLHLMLYPPGALVTFLQLGSVPVGKHWYFRLFLTIFITANFLLSYLLEAVVLPNKHVINLLRRLRRKKQPKNRYKLIEQSIQEDPRWPHIGE